MLLNLRRLRAAVSEVLSRFEPNLLGGAVLHYCAYDLHCAMGELSDEGRSIGCFLVDYLMSCSHELLTDRGILDKAEMLYGDSHSLCSLAEIASAVSVHT